MSYGVVHKTGSALAILFVIASLAIASSSTELRADSNTPTPSASSNCTGANGQSQLGQYCGSAQSAQQGSDANSSLWKVWGGVASVCLHACLANAVSGPLGATYCTVDNTGGAAAEGIITKKYASSLTSIAASQSGQLAGLAAGKTATSTSATAANSNSNPSAIDTQAAKNKKSVQSACTAGAAAAVKSINDFRSMQAQDQVAQQNKSKANSLESGTNGAVGAGTQTAPSLSGGEGLNNGVAGASAATAALASTCASARQTSLASETIQCATGNDPSLPTGVGTQGFLNSFQQASGTDFGNFGNSGQSPADAIAQAAGGSVGTASEAKLAAVLKNIEGDLLAGSMDAAPYTASGGGGGAPAAEDSSANDPAKLMASMMEQLQGKNNAGGNPADGPQAVVFANQNRAPASIPQDRTLSLFDRVSYRYFYELKKMDLNGGENR